MLSKKYVDISKTKSYMLAHKRPLHNDGLASEHRYLGQPRQASHKLNKKQFKSGCGYKETSAKPKGYGMAKNRTDMETSSFNDTKPSYGAKTYKMFSGK